MQFPNPSASICRTMLSTRSVRSGCPCGSKARCETFAEVNNIAEAFGQAAAQAPQPMHAAASIARSAWCFGTGIEFASGAEPARAATKPPACTMRSSALRSTTKSLINRNGLARNGSIVIVSPSAKLRMKSWQAAPGCRGPCASPLMVSEHVPQIPSRQSESNATGSLPSSVRSLVQDVEHLEKRSVFVDVIDLVIDETAFRLLILLTPDAKTELHL